MNVYFRCWRPNFLNDLQSYIQANTEDSENDFETLIKVLICDNVNEILNSLKDKLPQWLLFLMSDVNYDLGYSYGNRIKELDNMTQREYDVNKFLLYLIETKTPFESFVSYAICISNIEAMNSLIKMLEIVVTYSLLKEIKTFQKDCNKISNNNIAYLDSNDYKNTLENLFLKFKSILNTLFAFSNVFPFVTALKV